MNNTNTLQELAWDAEDAGREVLIYRHGAQDDVITGIEIDGDFIPNDLLDQDLDSDDFAGRMWDE